MSRHYFDCRHGGRNIRVTLGYDRPTQEFFMQVQRRTAKGVPTLNFLYTSLADPENQPKDLDYYRERLTALGVVVPVDLFEAVWEDACTHRGNAIIEHFENGTQRVIYDEKERE